MSRNFVRFLFINIILLPSVLCAQPNLCDTSPDPSKQKLNGFPAKRDVLAESALYAVFSAIAYEDSGLGIFKLPNGWVRDASKQDPSGLFMAIFRNYAFKRLAVAYRGTEGTISDWINNLLPIVKMQSGPALAFTKEIIDTNQGWSIVLTGHSLGGGLAIEMSHRLDGVSVFAFNPSPRIGLNRSGYRNKRVVIREKHEPLAIVRGNPSVRKGWQLKYEALVDFTPGFFGQRLLEQHGIEGMALNLLALTSVWDPSSKLLYESICSAPHAHPADAP
jgi:hypothetical protein